MYHYVAEGILTNGEKPYEALFVFGDSYADTGNTDKFDFTVNFIGVKNNVAWRKPYGKTWPGTPTGRFSDGMIFIDFLGNHISLFFLA